MEPAAIPLDPVTSTCPSLSEFHDCGYISESTCSLRLTTRPGRSRTGHVRRRAGDLLASPNGLREKGVDRSGVELNPGTQRPREGPAPLGQAQTSEIGMQPCAPAGMPSPRVGNRDSLHRHHTQQSGSRRPSPATHTSPDWLGGPLLAAAPNVVRAGVDRPPTASRHDSSV